MTDQSRLPMPIADPLALAAAVCAALAAAAGLFVPSLYRDPAPIIVQGRALDLVTLLVGVPVLVLGLILAARGSVSGRLVTLGALGYVLYTYAQYAFTSVVNPASLLYIAAVGSSFWSLALMVPAVAVDLVDRTYARRLPRRSAAAFLLVIAAAFAALWLKQLFDAAVSGVLPEAVRQAGLPTSPIYVLDLAFLLPLCALTALGLLRRDPRAPAAAVALLVFSPLLSLSILSLSLFSVLDGQTADVGGIAVFILAALAAVGLVAVTLRPVRPGAAAPA